MKSNKLKKIAAILTLLAMSTGKVNAASLKEIKKNARETYQEWGNPEYKNYLREIYDDLPEPILELIKQRHVHVVILDNENECEKVYEQIYGNEMSSELVGITIPEILTCFVEGSSHHNYYNNLSKNISNLSEKDFNKLLIKTVLVHEIGHVIDCYDAYEITNSDEFKNIYEQEKEFIKNTTMYNINLDQWETFIKDENEYFATILACYVFYPEELLDYCPLSYNYINSFLNKVELNKSDKSK